MSSAGGREDAGADLAARVDETARRFVDELLATDSGSPEFERSLAKIDRLGEKEMRATAAIAGRFGDLPITSLAPMLADDGALARHIAELRELCRALAKLQSGGRTDRERAAAQIERREQDIQRLAVALDGDRSTLLADNAALAREENVLSHEIEALTGYAQLAERLDELASERGMEVSILLPIRQRRRDLLAQLAIATQAKTSLRLMRRRNVDVIRALSSASATTITALRTTGLALRFLREESVPELESISRSTQGWSAVLSTLDDVEARRKQLRAGGAAPHR